MSRLRAGLVGLGAMGRNHARVLAGLEGVDLVGVVEPAGDPHRLAQGAAVVDTVEELLGLGVDYAVVACPTGLHEQVGLALAEAGVAALIEKPLAHSVAAAERLAEAFGARGLVAGVGHIERYNPALQSLRARLEAGELGEVYQVVTRRQGPFPARIADVGVVKDLATHDIDLTAWVTGHPYTSVAARTVTRAAARTRTWSPPSASCRAASWSTTWSTGSPRSRNAPPWSPANAAASSPTPSPPT